MLLVQYLQVSNHIATSKLYLLLLDLFADCIVHTVLMRFIDAAFVARVYTCLGHLVSVQLKYICLDFDCTCSPAAYMRTERERIRVTQGGQRMQCSGALCKA